MPPPIRLIGHIIALSRAGNHPSCDLPARMMDENAEKRPWTADAAREAAAGATPENAAAD